MIAAGCSSDSGNSTDPSSPGTETDTAVGDVSQADSAVEDDTTSSPDVTADDDTTTPPDATLSDTSEPADADNADTTAQPGGLPCDVATVLEQNCANCHAAEPLFGAPMALVTREDLLAPALTQPGKSAPPAPAGRCAHSLNLIALHDARGCGPSSCKR